MVHEYVEFLREILFPRYCLGCRGPAERGGTPLCDSCRASVRLERTLFCGRCRSRLPRGTPACHQNARFIFGAAADYEDAVVKSLIHALKFKGIRSAAEPLADFLASYTRDIPLPWETYQFVSIPLSPRRQRERGFNQAEAIAAAFARRIGVPLHAGVLVRVRHTRPQTDLGAGERRENVAGCFAVVRPDFVRGKRMVLLDDVITSGATIASAADALLHAGAPFVIGLAASKASHETHYYSSGISSA